MTSLSSSGTVQLQSSKGVGGPPRCCCTLGTPPPPRPRELFTSEEVTPVAGRVAGGGWTDLGGEGCRQPASENSLELRQGEEELEGIQRSSILWEAGRQPWKQKGVRLRTTRDSQRLVSTHIPAALGDGHNPTCTRPPAGELGTPTGESPSPVVPSGISVGG